MHARYYSPNLGRFVSVDPIGGRIGSSQSWNRYAYVQNNPLKFTDPEGEWVHIAIGAGVGGLIGAGAKMISNSAQGKPLLDNVGKAAFAGAAGGAVTAATFGVGAVAITGGGTAAALGTLTGATTIPTAVAGGGLTVTGGLIVGGGSSALGGATTGALNEALVEGNTDPAAVAAAAGEQALKSGTLGALTGGAGAGPATEAVVSELVMVYDAAKEHIGGEFVEVEVPPEVVEE